MKTNCIILPILIAAAWYAVWACTSDGSGWRVVFLAVALALSIASALIAEDIAKLISIVLAVAVFINGMSAWDAWYELTQQWH